MHSPSTACKFMILGSISLASPAFFSTFPHGTCALSVYAEYLALGHGRPGFLQGFTFPVVLGILLGGIEISRTRLLLCFACLSMHFCYLFAYHIEVPQPPALISCEINAGFRLFPFRSPLLGKSHSFSLPLDT